MESAVAFSEGEALVEQLEFMVAAGRVADAVLLKLAEFGTVGMVSRVEHRLGLKQLGFAIFEHRC